LPVDLNWEGPLPQHARCRHREVLLHKPDNRKTHVSCPNVPKFQSGKQRKNESEPFHQTKGNVPCLDVPNQPGSFLSESEKQKKYITMSHVLTFQSNCASFFCTHRIRNLHLWTEPHNQTTTHVPDVPRLLVHSLCMVAPFVVSRQASSGGVEVRRHVGTGGPCACPGLECTIPGPDRHSSRGHQWSASQSFALLGLGGGTISPIRQQYL
jgi:hypothetical protein